MGGPPGGPRSSTGRPFGGPLGSAAELLERACDPNLSRAITQADGDGDEEAERDYVEVIEYLRLAALTVFTEHGWVEAAPASKTSPKPAPPADNERTLH